ncbi:MAG: TetR/AcrR family transcriptional regulator [Bacteroidales bacterium]|jgi:AcrR family transcriptional regulator|nr:TetR/AcrR family transcriptional regulator [Bacteroidales bacterium]
MENNDLTTEQVILNAAEEEFLDKGYGNAKTVAIAKRAGVSHSMLHYYFRTKEKLFQMIFEKKIASLIQSFVVILDKDAPFEQMIRQLMEAQFNFVAKQPRLPIFVFNEILQNKSNRDLVIELLAPHISVILGKIETKLNEEIEKGNVRPISLINLMMNILSLNISVFIALPVLKDVMNINSKKEVEKILAERRENNVRFVFNALMIR